MEYKNTKGYKRLQAQCNATSDLGSVINNLIDLNKRLKDNEIIEELIEDLTDIMKLLRDGGLPTPNIKERK